MAKQEKEIKGKEIKKEKGKDVDALMIGGKEVFDGTVKTITGVARIGKVAVTTTIDGLKWLYKSDKKKEASKEKTRKVRR